MRVGGIPDRPPLSLRWVVTIVAATVLLAAALALLRTHAPPAAPSSAAGRTTAAAPDVRPRHEADDPPQRHLAATATAPDDPVLLAGRVIDASGTAVEGFRIHVLPVEPVRVPRSSSPPTDSAGGSQRRPPRKDADVAQLEARLHAVRAAAAPRLSPEELALREECERIRHETRLDARRTTNGGFVVRGQTPAKELVVSVMRENKNALAPPGVPVEKTFAVGGQDVRIVLPAFGGVSATVLDRGSVRAATLRLALKQGDREIAIPLQWTSSRDRVFTAAGVPMGHYDLHVRTEIGTTLVVLSDVYVPSEAWCDDRRLRAINLLRVWRRIDVTLRDADRRPLSVFDLAELRCEVQRPDGSRVEASRLSEGVLHIDALTPWVQLTVRSPRYCTEHLDMLRGDLVLELQPRPVVELRARPRPAEPLRLQLIGTGQAAEPIPITLADEPVRVRVPSPGRYSLTAADDRSLAVSPTTLYVIGDFLAVPVSVRAR